MLRRQTAHSQDITDPLKTNITPGLVVCFGLLGVMVVEKRDIDIIIVVGSGAEASSLCAFRRAPRSSFGELNTQLAVCRGRFRARLAKVCALQQESLCGEEQKRADGESPTEGAASRDSSRSLGVSEACPGSDLRRWENGGAEGLVSSTAPD